ncbi:MAG: PilN domain-containing protein [Chitinispirillales bacterium]|jgi:Tfp pilus assembly protein PilN|nr:PilN domain-containing protein [Chitinispirillales bacterium]
MVDRIEINLLPAEYRVRKRSLALPRSIVYPAIILFALAIGMALTTIYLNDKSAQLTEEIAAIEKEIAANKHIQAEINKLREEKQITDQKIRALERISVDREKWVRLLEILSGSRPERTWLVSVKEEGAKLVLEARTYAFADVAIYMNNLKEAEYIRDVGLVSVEQIQGPQEMKVYKFNVHCALNSDMGLGPELEPAEPKAGEGAGGNQGKRGKRGKAKPDEAGGGK